MTKQNRNPRSHGPAAAAALLLLLAASSALAISAVGERPGPGQRRRAMWESQIGVMDIFVRNYGGADWSLVLSDLDAHPEDPANPAFMSIPLSLANVYLNRYENGGNKANLERSLQIFEWVAAGRELWGGREGTGSVVSYLDIGVARLRAECDVGGFESRIDELWQTAMKITAEEAGALLETVGVPGWPCGPDSPAGRLSRVHPAVSRRRARRWRRGRRSSRRRRVSWPRIRARGPGPRTP